MGRKKKPLGEVRETVSIRLLPDIEQRLADLTVSRQAKSKSAMAEKLLRNAIELSDLDQSLRQLIAIWSRLPEHDREIVLRMAQTFEPVMALPPDPYEGGTFPDDIAEYDDGPPDRWER